MTRPTGTALRWTARAVLVVGGLLAVALAVWLFIVLLSPADGRFDRVLGNAEVLLVAAALAGLVAYVRGRARWPFLALAIVVGLTVAQPFGIRVDPAEVTGSPNLRSVDPTEPQRLEIAGIPLIRFELYSRELVRPYGEGGDPTHSLRVRSWIPPLLMYNASPVTEMCGVVTDPCWKPNSPSFADAPGIQLIDRDRWRVRTTSLDEDPATGRRRVEQWKLSFGLVSPSGVAYWALVAIALLVAGRNRRKREFKPATFGL